jgi:hypothetical protein
MKLFNRDKIFKKNMIIKINKINRRKFTNINIKTTKNSRKNLTQEAKIEKKNTKSQNQGQGTKNKILIKIKYIRKIKIDKS